ncbi:MAG: hypothetical protein CVV64_08930 [Candidatus Wallbacteria bacterium HGW-Wallbacteria-1]|uniref:Transglycosylase SLT domain-containing protein n=1 Tax=Candidatus Wallbacteria bacterium HGW-Wallbacteria-1 TaxID=2013854 RepID=A0A2N1PQ68_9BACT|nr:MAG: hypothetical protein CVV64_08930 [Candidatus Wallbacteria bacterium HGW-Wallbacteria-1]
MVNKVQIAFLFLLITGFPLASSLIAAEKGSSVSAASAASAGKTGVPQSSSGKATVAGDLKETLFKRGVRQMKAGDYAAASRDFLKAVNVDFIFSDLARYYHGRCSLALARKESRSNSAAGRKHLEQAEQSMMRLVEYYPASPLLYKALVDMGRIRLELGNTEGAIHAFRKALEEASNRPEIDYIYTTDGPAAVFQLLLDALESQRKWGEAADTYFQRLTRLWLRENGHVLRQRLVELGKKYKLPYVERKYYREMAAIYSRTGNHARVVEVLGNALGSGEKLPDNLNRIMALSLSAIGRKNEALQQWRLMKMKAGRNSSLTLECDYNIAGLLKALGQKDEALKIWTAIASEHPKSYLADNSLLAAAQCNDGEADLRLLERVVWEYTSGDVASRSMQLALEILEKQGGTAGTIPFLKKTISLARDTALYPFTAFRLAEAYTQTGKKSKAHSVLETLVKESPDDYYSIFTRLGPERINAMGFEGTKREVRNFDHGLRLSFAGLPKAGAGPVKVADHILALRLKEHDMALLLLHDRIRKVPGDLQSRFNLCLAYYLTGRYNATIRNAESFWNSAAMKKSFPKLEYLAFPFCHAAAVLKETDAGQKVDPLFVQAIMREESRFKHSDVSWSGAIGLMQIMPKTGAWIATKRGDSDFRDEKLFDPSTNIRYGSWYIDYLSGNVGRDLFDIAAAYNGGPGSVAKWKKKFGNLSREAFVEAIPFDETRRYVKKVIRSYAIYRRLYVPVSSGK